MDFLGTIDIVLSVLLGLFLLVILVVVHELGHAIAARRNGVVVEEFGIGFPPKAWGKKLKNGVLFTLNWLPLGGFVKLQGENDSANKKGDYGAASLWAKAKILLAGVFINWLTAAVIFTVLAVVGLPQIIENQFSVPADTTEVRKPVTVALVSKDSPAEGAGLQAGDQIVSFDGQPVTSPEMLTHLTEAHKGEAVHITYSRDGHETEAEVKLRNEVSPGQGYLGVGPTQEVLTRSTWSAPIVGVGVTAQFTWVTLQGLGSLVADVVMGLISQFSFDSNVRQEGGERISAAGDQVAGPVGILGVIFPAAREAGVTTVLMLTAIISLTLAVMNALPIPALDGGRLFVTLLFRALKKPLTKEREEKIHGTGFMILILLVVTITILDVGRLFE